MSGSSPPVLNGEARGMFRSEAIFSAHAFEVGFPAFSVRRIRQHEVEFHGSFSAGSRICPGCRGKGLLAGKDIIFKMICRHVLPYQQMSVLLWAD